MIRNVFEATCSVAFSSRTIRRRLNETGIDRRSPLLTKDTENSSVDDWIEAFLTDETRVCLKHPDGCERVW